MSFFYNLSDKNIRLVVIEATLLHTFNKMVLIYVYYVVGAVIDVHLIIVVKMYKGTELNTSDKYYVTPFIKKLTFTTTIKTKSINKKLNYVTTSTITRRYLLNFELLTIPVLSQRGSERS